MSKSFFRFGLLACVLLFSGASCLSLTNDQTVSTSGPAGMFVSTDKGENWQPISVLPQVDGIKNINQISVYRLKEDPQDSKALYWASRSSGLFFSFNDGKTWQIAPEPLNTGFVYDVAVHPKNKCFIIATNGERVYKSIDCLRSWQEVHRDDRPEARVAALFFDPFNNNAAFIAKNNGDILSSIDGGKSWTVISRFGAAVEDVKPDLGIANVFYAATRGSGMFRSVDGGKTWANLSDKLNIYPGATQYRRMLIHPKKAGALYWISTYGILFSTDQGDSWFPLNLITSPGSVDIYGFGINPNNDKEIYYTSTLSGRSTFFKTSDGGKNWITKKMPSGQLPTVLRVHPENSSLIYLGFTIPPKQ
jgi:photosystem II stability/assembly factor-like uncharacterized protein